MCLLLKLADVQDSLLNMVSFLEGVQSHQVCLGSKLCPDNNRMFEGLPPLGKFCCVAQRPSQEWQPIGQLLKKLPGWLQLGSTEDSII